MAFSLSNTKIPLPRLHKNRFSFHSSRLILSLPFFKTPLLHSSFSPLKASASDGDSLLGKPVFSQKNGIVEERSYCYEQEEEDSTEEDKWIDWEDQILDDTVPLVGFVRMILHSGQ